MRFNFVAELSSLDVTTTMMCADSLDHLTCDLAQPRIDVSDLANNTMDVTTSSFVIIVVGLRTHRGHMVK
jgi:hypothetical protein